MARVISHRELRNNSSAILREVQAGESFDITNNGEIVARLVPPTERSGPPPLPMRKATRKGGFAGLTVVSGTLQGFNLLQPDRAIFVEAGLQPGTHLRSLDTPHIATAVRAGADSIVSYDARQSEIAGMVGLRVVAPA